MSIFKRDTLPKIGDYEFSWTPGGCITVTDRAGKADTYSVEALSRLANSRGISTANRDKACAALDWATENPLKRSSREFTTTPNL